MEKQIHKGSLKLKTTWMQRPINELATIHSGRDYKHLKKGKIPVYGTGGYMTSVDEALSTTDAVGIGRKGTINKPQFLSAPFWTVDTLFFITAKDELDLVFFYYLIQNINWQRYDESTGVPSLSKKTIENIKVKIPKIEEQKLIGKILKNLDENIIALEQEKLNHILEIKHAFLRKVYSTKANDNMILFKMNKYISKKGKINKENKEYIVSSVNNKKGFINQSEQFESTRLNNLDKSTYRIIDPKDFAYNPSRINVGSIGYNDTDNTLIVSPLYIVFRLNDEINDKYFYYYTQTEKFLYEVNRNTEGSVRQSLTFENMGNINIPIPNNYQIQLLISQYFKKIDNIIFITEQKINRCKKIKTYLLQSLFV